MSVVSQVKLLVLDVDGTILTSEHRISPATRRAVGGLVDRGVGVVLASSRGPAGLRPVMSDLGVSGFAVAYQGALICRLSPDTLAPDETLIEARISLQTARTVFRAARTKGLSVGWHAGEVWYVPEIDAAIRREAGITGQAPVVADLEQVQEEPHKVLCIAGEPSLMPKLRRLFDFVPEECTGHFSHYNYLEITRREADKASALEVLGKQLGVGLDEMAAIGDGENDAAMLREAGLGIAMGQAPPPVKDLADWVTESNDRDGIAAAVERLLAEGRMPAS
jgi:Cof subfamily protein (haloacid dehalogenase superfamily)